MRTSLRLDRLLGREVHTANNRRLGRLQEFRVERDGTDWVVREYVIGAAGLLERLGLGMRMVFGMKRTGGYVARWDQMDLTNPNCPRISCPVDDLQRP